MQLKSADEIAGCSSHNSASALSVMKHSKLTESTGSLCRNMLLSDVPWADLSALVSASDPTISGSCKQEGSSSEVVSSDVDYGDFLDIWKTLDGCEPTLEFQKCLSESDRDDINLNFSSDELTCLSVSDVNDIVAERPTASQQNVPSLQTSCQSDQLLHGDTKYAELSSSSQSVSADNFSMQPWHQTAEVHQPVMNNLKLLIASVPTHQHEPCPELLKQHQVIQTKQLPGRSQLPSYDVHSLSRMQAIQHQQQPQSWYQPYVSTHHAQPYVMTPDQSTWPQSQWQTSAQCTQQTQQLLPCQFVPMSVGLHSHAVKREMTSSVIVSPVTDAVTRSHQQMLSFSENSRQVLPPQYASLAAAAPANQSQVSQYAGYQQ